MAIPRFKLVSGPTNIRTYPEHTTHGSYLAGDIVDLVAGKVKLATGTGLGAGDIAGVAVSNYVGTAGTNVAVYEVTPQQVWRAFPNSAVKPTSGFSRGLDYNIKQASAGAGEVSTAAGADAIVVDVRWAGQDGTTAEDPLLIKFDQLACKTEVGD